MDAIAVIYWSGTGNTAMMADEIAKGAQSAGAEVSTFSVESFPQDTFNQYSKIAFGCPSMGNEVLEEYDFEPFFASIEGQLRGKKVALFGSYGWGDGQWMRDWQQRVSDQGANLYQEGLILNGTPDASGLEECNTFGKGFAAF